MPKQQEDMISAFDACKLLYEENRDEWLFETLDRLKQGKITAYGCVQKAGNKRSHVPVEAWCSGLRMFVWLENAARVCHAKDEINNVTFYNISFKKDEFEAQKSAIRNKWQHLCVKRTKSVGQPIGGYIRLQEACLLLATGQDWTHEKIMERENEQCAFQKYQKYLHALLNDKEWPTLSDASGDVEYFEILKDYARQAQWRMAFLDKTPKQFLDHVNQSISDYEELAGKLSDAERKIRNNAAERRITLWGKPTTAGKNYSANDLEVIPLGAILNERMILWWFGSKFWYQGEMSAERNDENWVDVTLLRSEVERLWPRQRAAGTEKKTKPAHKVNEIAKRFTSDPALLKLSIKELAQKGITADPKTINKAKEKVRQVTVI